MLNYVFKYKSIFFLILCLLNIGISAEYEDILAGFDEEEPSAFSYNKKDLENKVSEINTGELTALFNFFTNYQLQNRQNKYLRYKGLSSSRIRMDLAYEKKLLEKVKLQISLLAEYESIYKIRDKNYPDNLIDADEYNFELKESFLEFSLTENLDITTGRQILVWGKSDSLKVTDIINPMNLENPGIADIKYLRLPVLMTRLDLQKGSWLTTLSVIHEKRFNRYPEKNSSFDFMPYRDIYDDTKSISLNNDEYSLSLQGNFSVLDIAFYLASLYDNTAFLNNSYNFQHARIKMQGFSLNIPRGNWLIKIESAFLKGLRYSGAPAHKKERLDILGGIEYSGFKDSQLSLEVVERTLCDYITQELPTDIEKRSRQLALRYSRDFYHDRLNLTALFVREGQKFNEGGYLRAALEYDLNDSTIIKAGAVSYFKGDKIPYNSISDNDLVYSEISYYF